MALGTPLLLLLAVEGVLRLVGFGYPTSFFVPRSGAPGQLVENPGFGRRFFPPGLLRVPPPTTLDRQKSEGTIRILVFGESAAMGDPKPAFGVARYLEVLLRERHPGVRFEVVPVAMTAINSHALLPMARECTALGADYWIVYAGNNEMLGPFGAGTTLGGTAAPWPLVRLILASKATRLGQAFELLAQRLRPRPTGSSRWEGLRALASENVASGSPQRARVYEAYERNLRDVVIAGRAAGVQVLLSTMAVNLRDGGPFGSVHEPPLDAAGITNWDRLIEQGRVALTNERPADALAAFTDAAAKSPRHAAAQFLLGEALLVRTNGGIPAAAEAFARARDLDTVPLRADSRLNDITRQVATRTGVGLIDAVTALAAASPVGVPGGESFYEHVHLTPEGNYALARAFAEALEPTLPASVRSKARADWASAVTCGTRLALTPWGRAAGAELMLRRCVDAPFTQQIEHTRHVDSLAAELLRQRRAQTPESAKFIRGVYTNAIAAAPRDHHLARNYAEFLEATGDLAGAASQWGQVLELLPHHPVAYLQRGSLLRRLGKLDEAQPLIEKAVAMQPDWIEARLEWSELLMARGQPEAAVVVCREALVLQPDHARAHLRLADALAAAKQGEAAIKSLEEAVRLDPRLWEARYLLGVEYGLQDKIEAARDQFQQVVRLKPDHARGQFNLGIALAKLRQWEPAAEHLAEALRLDPKNDGARQTLAQVIGIRQKLQERAATNAPVLGPR